MNLEKKVLRPDFQLRAAALIAIFVTCVSVCFGVHLPVEFAYENGWVENIQLFVLMLGVYFCLTSGNHRMFFLGVAWVLIILMLREVNCGRTVFFARPGEVNSFFRWREIPYGWVARVLFGVCIASIPVFFLRNGLYKELSDVLSQVGMPVWNVLLMAVGIALGVYGEWVMNSMVVEELAELVSYVALVGCLHIYARV